MTDQKSVAEEKVVENVTTQTESPPVEVPATEEQTTQEVSVDQSTSSESTDDTPAGSENWTAEQRRAFQEQRQEIKRLKEQVEEKAKGESAFNTFRPQTAPVSQTVNVESFRDPLTGETNWNAYQAAQARREQELIAQARFEAQQTTQELLDENSARIKHPEEFKDKNFEQRVADRWFAAKMRGENPSISNIADDEARLYSKAVSKAEKIGAEKAFNELSEKEKAGLSASGQTSSPARQEASTEDYERLRLKSRGGDDDVITARISKIPWAGK